MTSSTQQLTPSAGTDDFGRERRSVLAWIGCVTLARPALGKVSRWDRIARVLPAGLSALGLLCNWWTPREAWVAPLPIQLLEATAIIPFAIVGFWMKCWPEQRTRVVGGLFSTIATIGAVSFLLVRLSNLMLSRIQYAGRFIGWLHDMSFLPAMIVLPPMFLLAVPSGTPLRGRSHVIVIWCSGVAAVVALFGLMVEPSLRNHTEVPAIIPQLSIFHDWAGILAAGLVLAAVAFVGAFAVAWRERPMERREAEVVKWYGYMGVLALLGLAPVALLTSPKPGFESTVIWVWGLLVAIAVAVAAVPAASDALWRPERMERLVRGALIAAAAAALHEFLVMRATHDTGVEAVATRQSFIIYAVGLILAVLFEPLSVGFSHLVESVFHRRTALHKVLEDGHAKMQEASDMLRGAYKRIGRTDCSSRDRLRRYLLSDEPPDGSAMVGQALDGIRSTLVNANRLVDTIETACGDLRSAAQRSGDSPNATNVT